MIRLSLIVSVLESYEVVRRQLLHLNQFLSGSCELILVDDGSEPPLAPVCETVSTRFPFLLHCTHDRRPWTQPRGRNIGASLAKAEKLLFFDIDHIITQDVIDRCCTYGGDKLHWVRRPGILDEVGNLVTDRERLLEYGLECDTPSVHANSFCIRRALFQALGGYDERFCGQYGGDDIDFNARYHRLCQQELALPEEVAGLGFVFPDPARDRKGLFHSLKQRAESNRS